MGKTEQYPEEPINAPVPNDETSALVGSIAEQPEIDTPLYKEEGPVYCTAILTTIPIFMGYACLVTLQAHIKHRIGIPDGKNHQSNVFGAGVGFLYFGNLIFRLLHNIIFSCLRPRHRVMLAYTCMTLATGLLGMIYYVAESKWIGWVYVCYGLGGMAIGTFESNLLSCITPLGHGTKSWAVLGIPLGFNGISVGAFLLFAFFPGDLQLQLGVYLFISAANLAGLLYYTFVFPHVVYEASGDTVKKFFNDVFRDWRCWLPHIKFHAAALLFDMFTVSLFSAEVLYIFDKDRVPLWPDSATTVPKNGFQCVYNLCAFLGDFSARKVIYMLKKPPVPNPLLFLVLNTVGAACVLSKTALIAPIGMFLIMFGNGSIYASTTKHIDSNVPKKFNLVALSVWLFVGDIGASVAAQVVQPLRGAIGDVPMRGEPTPAPTPNTTVPATPTPPPMTVVPTTVAPTSAPGTHAPMTPAP